MTSLLAHGLLKETNKIQTNSNVGKGNANT